MNLIKYTCYISKKFQRKMVIFRYPDKAWELLTTIATGKPRIVSHKTIKEGPLLGLIPISSTDIYIPDGCSSLEYAGEMVLTYKGYLVTSDLDILWIERKEGEYVITDPKLGYLTSLEKKIIDELNLAFRHFSKRNVEMITHGPYFNHKNPKKSDLVYPYDAFHPVLGHTELNDKDELKNFSTQLEIIENWPEQSMSTYSSESPD